VHTLLAMMILCTGGVTTAKEVCEQPSDCHDGVCISGTCRTGSASSAVETLYPLAVPPPVVLGTGARHKELAERFVEQLRKDLAWSGFYSMLSVERMPFSYRVEGASPSEARRLLWQQAGAFRVLRIVVRPGDSQGSVRILARLIEVESFEWIDLAPGELRVQPGQERAVAAACANRIVELDTGIPGVAGSRIATTIQTSPGVKEVGLVAGDGEGLTMITSNKSLNLDPAWDGQGRIGYMSYRAGNADWIVDGTPFSSRPGMNAAGAWSRDGMYLALSVTEGANSDIVILDGTTGTEQVRVTEHPGVDTSPTWSPDGKKLAFVSDRSGSPQVWIVTLATGDLKRLTHSGYNVSPDWSPNGHSILYGQLIGSKFVIKRHDFDVPRTVTLTGAAASSENPSFSADGRYVVFSRRGSDRRASLWVMYADGTHQRALTSNALPMFSPAWHRRAPTLKEAPQL
jgi:TolB protein